MRLKNRALMKKQANEILNTVESIQNARLEEVAQKSDISDLKLALSELKSDVRLTHWGIALVIAVLVLPYLKGLFT